MMLYAIVRRDVSDDHPDRVQLAFWTEKQAKEHFEDYWNPPDAEPNFRIDYRNIPVDWACPQCGGVNVQGTAWVNLLTNSMSDSEPPRDDYWCVDCDSERDDGDIGYLVEVFPLPHRIDRECLIPELADPDDIGQGECRTCGVLHGEPCPDCDGRGFHNSICKLATDRCTACDNFYVPSPQCHTCPQHADEHREVCAPRIAAGQPR